MSDSIEYRFHSEGKGHGIQRKGSLEIVTTKKVVDHVTSSRGPMLDDLREPSTRQVLQRRYAEDGAVTLAFDLDAMGRGYSNQPEARATKAIDIISQIDGFAAAEGWSDPRIHLRDTKPADGRLDSTDDFRVIFERPEGVDDEGLANKIQKGMWDAARFLRYYASQGIDQEHISARFTPEAGFTLHMQGEEYAPVRHPVFYAPPHRARPGQPIELLGHPTGRTLGSTKEKFGRLIAFTGIVSALGPASTTREQ
jgi:hypothetical protein